MTSNRALYLTAVLSISFCLTGCANNQALLQQAAAQKANADVAGQAIAEAKKLPEKPADCRRKETSGVVLGDRLDVAYLKAERAIQRGNARIERCAAWDDEFRAELLK